MKYFEDFEVGQTYSSSRVSVTAEQISAFAREFDPQPFHLDEQAAKQGLFRGLVASGWHTAALTMKLLVSSEIQPVGGLVGAGVDEMRWRRPVRPADELHLSSEVTEVRASDSRPTQGLIKVRVTTLNAKDEVVQTLVATLLVPRRPLPA